MYIYKLFPLSDPDKITYIGQTSKLIRQRLASHKADAKKEGGRRPICKWIISENFQIGVDVVEEVFGTQKELNEREVYWISKYRESYNLLNILKGGKGISGDMYGDKNGNSKRILQYDLHGNFIREWTSIIEASKTLQINFNKISNCICLDRVKSGGGFIWKYYKEGYQKTVLSTFPLKNSNIQNFKTLYGHIIYQFDLSGNLIKEWKTMHDIERFTNFKRAGVYYALRHTGIAYGYKWECKDRDIEQIPLKGPKLNFKKVLQYDLDGKFVKEWDSFKAAAESCNIKPSSISWILYCENKTCGGYFWRSYSENYPLTVSKFKDGRKVKRSERKLKITF